MNQAQTESFLSLVIFSIFADSKLSLKEGDALNKIVGSMEWRSRHPKDVFLLTAMGHARTAASSESSSEAFLAEKASVFVETADQEAVLQALKTILGSDGLVDDEAQFLQKVQAAFPS